MSDFELRHLVARQAFFALMQLWHVYWYLEGDEWAQYVVQTAMDELRCDLRYYI